MIPQYFLVKRLTAVSMYAYIACRPADTGYRAVLNAFVLIT